MNWEARADNRGKGRGAEEGARREFKHRAPRTGERFGKKKKKAATIRKSVMRARNITFYSCVRIIVNKIELCTANDRKANDYSA